MSKTYDDSVYGVEKVLTLPLRSLATTSLTTQLTLTEDIAPIEFGAWVTTALSLTGVAAQLTLYKSGATLTQVGLITILSGAALYTVRNTTTFTAGAFANGDVLVVKTDTSDSIGACVPYIKYKTRFVSG